MRPPSFRGGRLAALLAAGALVAGLWTGASPAPAVRAVEKPAVQEAGPVKAEKPAGGDEAKESIPPAPAVRAAEKPVVQEAGPVKAGKPPGGDGVNPAVLSVSKVEIQRQFNELRKELLDDRAAYIDRWLAATAIFLTLLGVLGGIGGYIGFSRFRQIEAEARRSVEAANKHETEAQKSAERAKQFVEEAEKDRNTLKALLINAEEFDRMSKDDPEKARQATQEVRENPRADLVDKAVAAALSLQQEGKRDEAIEKWRGIAKVAEGNDDDLAARAWFSVGYLLDEQGKYEKAIAAYSESIHLRPNVSVSYNNRGVAKKELRQYEAAMADYDEAIRLKPDYAGAYYNRGIAKSELGCHEAAMADYDEAIRLKPDHVNAYYNRGVAKYRLGRHKAAMADFDEAIRLKPDYAGAYLNRGIVNNALSDKDAARRDFGKARDLARAAGDEEVATNAEQALKVLDEQGA